MGCDECGASLQEAASADGGASSQIFLKLLKEGRVTQAFPPMVKKAGWFTSSRACDKVKRKEPFKIGDIVIAQVDFIDASVNKLNVREGWQGRVYKFKDNGSVLIEFPNIKMKYVEVAPRNFYGLEDKSMWR